MPKHSGLKISSTKSKRPNKKNLLLEENEQLAGAARAYVCLNNKNKKEYKDMNVCENAWGTVIEVLEFIENGTSLYIFLSSCFLEV